MHALHRPLLRSRDRRRHLLTDEALRRQTRVLEQIVDLAFGQDNEPVPKLKIAAIERVIVAARRAPIFGAGTPALSDALERLDTVEADLNHARLQKLRGG
jgi:hypothetical protein